MILLGFVPKAFGEGVLVPIPKGDKRNNNLVADYRGITICNIISKIFEQCLLVLSNKFLFSSNRQFGFKKGTGCQHAIYSLRKTVEYFTEKGSTVNVCTLDLASAFDRVNHFVLFDKLMQRNFPRSILAVLVSWYSKLFSSVKWGNFFSNLFCVTAGIRQGGILSPALFTVFVDDILNILEKSKLGCYIKNVCINSLMYADDLVLLSISLHHMQKLVDICVLRI